MIDVYCILSNMNLNILLLCISITSRSIVFEVTHKLQSVLSCVLDKSLNLYESNVRQKTRKGEFMLRTWPDRKQSIICMQFQFTYN